MLRTEYPRPQFKRKEWINLNGQWTFDYDDTNTGLKEEWWKKHVFSQTIQVPFAYQSQLSGIHSLTPHEVVWYQRQFKYQFQNNEDLLLHFGAVDYLATIWVDGQLVGSHTGGETSFTFNIAPYLTELQNHSLVVRVKDSVKDEEQPRGKQNWVGHSFSIFYTGTTGIWQTVWLEPVSKHRITSLKFHPDIDQGTINITGQLSDSSSDRTVNITISKDNTKLTKISIEPESNDFETTVNLFDHHIFRTMFHNDGWTWTPTHPTLFDCEVDLTENGLSKDEVKSYFGMRKIHSEEGSIYLNNRPIYQKLVLDQGYWPKGLLTAPDDNDFKRDIEMSKKMGFNGCRMHQKVEDPRFLYWADRLGYLVWGECAAAPAFTNTAISRTIIEWEEIIERDFNHPSIITWVPINESWGVPQIHQDLKQQHYAQTLYHLIHTLDNTRLVSSNDGWEQTITDICGIHNYAQGNADEPEKYKYFVDTLSSWQKLIAQPPGAWNIFAKGYHYTGQPIVLSECGGIAYKKASDDQGWGYTTASSDEDYLKAYTRVIKGIANSRSIVGFCYTQLCDVEQEVNGLLTYDRHFKVDPNKIREINDFFIPAKVLPVDENLID